MNNWLYLFATVFFFGACAPESDMVPETTISGKIIDSATGAPLSDAGVTFLNEVIVGKTSTRTEYLANTYTDLNGNYTLKIPSHQNGISTLSIDKEYYYREMPGSNSDSYGYYEEYDRNLSSIRWGKSNTLNLSAHYQFNRPTIIIKAKQPYDKRAKVFFKYKGIVVTDTFYIYEQKYSKGTGENGVEYPTYGRFLQKWKFPDDPFVIDEKLSLHLSFEEDEEKVLELSILPQKPLMYTIEFD